MWKRLIPFIKKLIHAYIANNISSMSAALAYYTIFSMTPILVICIALTGIFLGSEAANTQVLETTGVIIDPQTAQQIQVMVNNMSRLFHSDLTRILSFLVLSIGALGVFHEMQQGLNSIWGVKSNPNRSWLKIIFNRLFSFVMVLIISFLLFIFLILSLTLTAFSSWLSAQFGILAVTGFIFNYTLSFCIITILFALIFKILPDVIIQWREVWVGAVITTLLFILGKFLLGMYFNYTKVATIYGAAGSLIIILIWVYYSAQIFFIGAEITRLLAAGRGKQIVSRHDSIICEDRL